MVLQRYELNGSEKLITGIGNWLNFSSKQTNNSDF